jgi:hypothetical protein
MLTPQARFNSAWQTINNLPADERIRAVVTNDKDTYDVSLRGSDTYFRPQVLSEVNTNRVIGHLVRVIHDGCLIETIWNGIYEVEDGSLIAQASTADIKRSGGGMIGMANNTQIPPHNQVLALEATLLTIEQFLEPTPNQYQG